MTAAPTPRVKLWRDYADFLADHFEGKMQKVSVNLGLSCPNRDGTIGRGGCIYCNNSSFAPSYCASASSVTAQLEEGIRFFARKYPRMRYLAYFQAYTSTHARDVDQLMTLYREALAVPGVEGIIISTRPDCISEPLLDALAELPWVMIEYGAETSHDATLRLINRCHTWAQVERAVRLTAARGIPVGLHFIMGLPGESRADMLDTIEAVNALPVSTVKLHQLQVVGGTRLAAEVEAGRMALSITDPDDYAALCAEIVGRLRPDIAIERFVSQSPPGLLIAPRWGLKNYQFTPLVERRLRNAMRFK